MKTELENERKRIIEILGFYSAIVAFILSTVSIGINYSFKEGLFFLIGLGAMLILFCVAMSVLFSNRQTQLFKDKLFWILVSGIILVLVLLFKI